MLPNGAIKHRTVEMFLLGGGYCNSFYSFNKIPKMPQFLDSLEDRISKGKLEEKKVKDSEFVSRQDSV